MIVMVMQTVQILIVKEKQDQTVVFAVQVTMLTVVIVKVVVPVEQTMNVIIPHQERTVESVPNVMVLEYALRILAKTKTVDFVRFVVLKAHVLMLILEQILRAIVLKQTVIQENVMVLVHVQSTQVGRKVIVEPATIVSMLMLPVI